MFACLDGSKRPVFGFFYTLLLFRTKNTFETFPYLLKMFSAKNAFLEATNTCTVVILIKATKHAEREQINKSHWLNNVRRAHFIFYMVIFQNRILVHVFSKKLDFTTYFLRDFRMISQSKHIRGFS